MRSEKQRLNVLRMKRFTINADLVCDRCKVKKPKTQGRYIPYNNGLNQKWVCYCCRPAE